MTVRQRWTFLYPLLILAVCLGIKGELADKNLARQMRLEHGQLSVQSVKTNQIAVMTSDDERCIELGQTKDGAGLVLVYGPKSRDEPLVRIRVDQTGDHGVIDIRDAKGRLVTMLAGTDDGGVLQVAGRPNQRSLLLGHEGGLRVSGLLALEPGGRILTRSVRGRKLPVLGSYFTWYEEPPDSDSDVAPTEPGPADLDLDLNSAEPEPSSVKSEPSSVKPEPSSVKPEPSSVKSEPSSVQPEPSSVQPEPSSVQSEPSSTEPAGEPKPEPPRP